MTTEFKQPARLIVGLGNPGRKYRSTRHNLGFMVVDELAHRWRVRLKSSRCKAKVADRDHVTLAKPQTYMNRSGYSVRCLADTLGCLPQNVLVIYDDVALPLGRLRLRPQGSPGGHRGMESVVNNLRSEAVPRLRMGVGPKDRELSGEELVDYVLGPLSRDESVEVDSMIERAASACETWIETGIDAAMNAFNG